MARKPAQKRAPKAAPKTVKPRAAHFAKLNWSEVDFTSGHWGTRSDGDSGMAGNYYIIHADPKTETITEYKCPPALSHLLRGQFRNGGNDARQRIRMCLQDIA